MTTATVRRATSADVEVVASTLAQALLDDPVTAWLFPNDSRRRQRAHAFFAWTLRTTSLPLDEVWCTEDGSAAALWAPPGRWRLGLVDQARLMPTALRLFGAHTPRIVLGFNRLEGRHPVAPHWYLYFIATRPAQQGRGLGGALMAHMLGRADTEGLGTYLEASTARVVPFYARHGFEVTEEFALPRGPRWWLMWRAPRG